MLGRFGVFPLTLNSRDHGLLRVDALPTQRHFGTRLVHWQGQGITRLAEHEVVPLHRCEQWRIRLGKYGNTWTQTPNGEMHYVFWMGLPRREMPGDVELRMPWGNYVILYYRIHIEKKHQIIFCSRFLEPLMLLIIILLGCKHIMTFRDIQVSHE